MKLKQGQVIKNYNELCKLLNVVPTKGKGRKYHIREFERYCTYIKEGHKFIVDEVYAEEKPRIDKRSNNGQHFMKYDALMDTLILNLLLTKQDDVEETFPGLMRLINIFSNKYADLSKGGYTAFAKNNSLGIGVTLVYQQKLFNTVRKCLETALKRLRRQGIIQYQKKTLIRDRKFRNTLATEIEETIIKNAEKEVYEETDISWCKRINPTINQKFKRKVVKKITSIDITNYWNVYCFKLIDKNIKVGKVEKDKDELIRRLVASVEGQVKKHKQYKQNDFSEKYQPYSYPKYQEQIDKLSKLLWILPENYKADTEIEIEEKIKHYEMYIQFGKEMTIDSVPF